VTVATAGKEEFQFQLTVQGFNFWPLVLQVSGEEKGWAVYISLSFINSAKNSAGQLQCG
jgi:hypothetical protein